MKILFLCGSVEPGKDGVGDYTRRLCGELIRSGYKAQIISLYDKHEINFNIQTQLIEETPVIVSRIPITTSYKQRLAWTQEIVKEVAPDWISLQYVPSSFDNKGLPFWLSRFLNNINSDSKNHIMFHELVFPNNSLKNKCIRFLQKQIIKLIVFNFKPKIINTHTPYYLKLLSSLKINAQPLPLFSNIPIVNYIGNTTNSDIFKLGLFSKIIYSEEINKTLENLSNLLSQNNKLFEIILLGGKEEDVQNFKNSVTNNNKIKAQVVIKGFLSNKELSIEFQKLDIGLTPVSNHLLGKSGSVSAFLEHGISVIAPIISDKNGFSEIGFFDEKAKNYIIQDSSKFDIVSTKKTNIKINSVKDVSLIFVNYLKG